MKHTRLAFAISLLVTSLGAKAQNTPSSLTSIFEDIQQELLAQAPHVQYCDTFSCAMHHSGYAPHVKQTIDLSGIEAYLDLDQNREVIRNAFVEEVLEHAQNEWKIDLYQLCYMRTASSSFAVMFMDYKQPYTTKSLLEDVHGMNAQESSEAMRNRIIESISNRIEGQMVAKGIFDADLLELMSFEIQKEAMHHPDFSCHVGILPSSLQTHQFRDCNYSVEQLADSISELTFEFHKSLFPDAVNSDPRHPLNPLNTGEFRYAVSVEDLDRDRYTIKTLLCPLRSQITFD